VGGRYLATIETIIQASVARATLPANTSGKKRPQLRLCQGVRVEGENDGIVFFVVEVMKHLAGE
jgi:hypothetical protein